VDEQPLAGGFVNEVARVGSTVRRPMGGRAQFVHELLGVLEEQGWPGAPRFLGVDEQGREILSFIDGHAAWEPALRVEVTSELALVRVAEMVRELHDLTAGTRLAGSSEAVCHNDLSPKNTVYRDGGDGWTPVAFIDWDLAAPGERIHDVAHLCWEYLHLGPEVTNVTQAAGRLRLICDAYGLTDRARLLDTVLWWQDRCWRGIEAGAVACEPAMVRLRDSGAGADVRAAFAWTRTHRDELEAELRLDGQESG
jgi:aminoglycoside phosphotransferase (APT) family kinase protein